MNLNGMQMTTKKSERSVEWNLIYTILQFNWESHRWCALECEYIDNKYEFDANGTEKKKKRKRERERGQKNKTKQNISNCEAILCCLTVNAIHYTLPKPI